VDLGVVPSNFRVTENKSITPRMSKPTHEIIDARPWKACVGGGGFLYFAVGLEGAALSRARNQLYARALAQLTQCPLTGKNRGLASTNCRVGDPLTAKKLLESCCRQNPLRKKSRRPFELLRSSSAAQPAKDPPRRYNFLSYRIAYQTAEMAGTKKVKGK